MTVLAEAPSPRSLMIGANQCIAKRKWRAKPTAQDYQLYLHTESNQGKPEEKPVR